MKATRVRVRVDDYNIWHSVNPVLLNGEIGFIKDEVSLVIGDGQHDFDWLYANMIMSSSGSQAVLQNADPVFDFYTYDKVCANTTKYVLRNYGTRSAPNFYIALAVTGSTHQQLSYDMSISNATVDGSAGNLYIESNMLKKKTSNATGTVYIGHKSVTSPSSEIGVVQHAPSGVWIYNMYNGANSCMMTPKLIWRNPNIRASDKNYSADFTSLHDVPYFTHQFQVFVVVCHK